MMEGRRGEGGRGEGRRGEEQMNIAVDIYSAANTKNLCIPVEFNFL